MKSFKAFVFMAAMAVILGLAFNTQVYAQQSGNFGANEYTSVQNGNDQTGSIGQTGATAKGQTPSTAGSVDGYANLSGTSTSNAHVVGVVQMSDASSKSTFSIGAKGPGSTISIAQFAGGSTWATAPSQSSTAPAAIVKFNYADGGGGNGATVVGSSDGGTICNPLTGNGETATKGATSASSIVTPDGLNAVSKADTVGSSNARGVMTGSNPQLSTTAIGSGGIEGGAYSQGPNSSSAGGTFVANTQYGATSGPSGIASSAGSYQAHGITTTSVSPSGNTATAQTIVSSTAQAH